MKLPVQQLHRADLTAWLQDRQSRLEINTSTYTPAGKILDWVAKASQTTQPIASPPPPLQGPAVAIDPERPTRAISFDIGEPGPEGHVPLLRPDLRLVADTVRLQDVLSKRGGRRLRARRREVGPAPPDPQGYFHATTAESLDCYGCQGWLNVWEPQVNLPHGSGLDHSITQTWLLNYQALLPQSVEAGLTVDPSLNGDAASHLFSFYTTNNYAATGDRIGGYNRLQVGWIQVHPSIYPGICISRASAQGVTPQLELGLKFQLYQSNWWLGVNVDAASPWIWLGYYPGTLFAGGLSDHADWVSFGGEVYTDLGNPCLTTDQMGSGLHAERGWKYACYQRNMRFQSSSAGAMSIFAGTPEVDPAAPDCAGNQYSLDTFVNSGSLWETYQYFGGQA